MVVRHFELAEVAMSSSAQKLIGVSAVQASPEG